MEATVLAGVVDGAIAEIGRRTEGQRAYCRGDRSRSAFGSIERAVRGETGTVKAWVEGK